MTHIKEEEFNALIKKIEDLHNYINNELGIIDANLPYGPTPDKSNKHVQPEIAIQKVAYEAGLRRAIHDWSLIGLSDTMIKRIVEVHCYKDFCKIAKGEPIT